jgi:hypothetical protein
MMTNTAGTERDSRDNRRWQIGVAISLVFGLFGMLMALLNYTARAPSSSPATNVTSEQQHGKSHKKH